MLDRLLTTKYPLGVVLMQLAHEMRTRRLLLRARWLPRLQNQEADDLTNDEFHHFRAEKRIPVDLNNLGFDLMDSLFAAGDEYRAGAGKSEDEASGNGEGLGAQKAAQRKRPLVVVSESGVVGGGQ